MNEASEQQHPQKELDTELASYFESQAEASGPLEDYRTKGAQRVLDQIHKEENPEKIAAAVDRWRGMVFSGFVFKREAERQPNLNSRFQSIVDEITAIEQKARTELARRNSCSPEILKQLDEGRESSTFDAAAVAIFEDSYLGPRFNYDSDARYNTYSFNGSFENFLKELERRGFAFNIEHLQKMTTQGGVNEQIFALRAAQHLDEHSYEQYGSWWAKEYWSLVEKGNTDVAKKGDLYFLDSWDPAIENYENEIINLLGAQFSRRATPENKERYEHTYLDLLQKYIAKNFFNRNEWSEISRTDFFSHVKEGVPWPSDSFDEPHGYYGGGHTGDEDESDDDILTSYAELEQIESLECDEEFEVQGINRAFDHLARFGGKETVDFLAAWHEGKPYVNTRRLANVLSKIDPHETAKRFFPLLKHRDPIIARATSYFLYHLELGRIGISEKGVKYFERLYDLGEYNNPDYFVQRLTADGDVGIFTENRELAKYFNLGDLTTEESVIRAKLLSFSYETLFTPKADETPEERSEREAVLEEFQKKYFKFYDDSFFKETGLRFNGCSFKEQGQFLHFAEHVGQEKKDRALRFVRQFGAEGLRVFLSLDYGSEYGERLLAIAENYPRRDSEKLIREYVVLENNIQVLGERLANVLGEDREFVIQFQEALSRRAKDILNVAFQISQSGQATADFYGREIKTENPNEPIEAFRTAQKMSQVVRAFLSDKTNERELFTFLEPIIDESVVAHAPAGVSNEKGLWTCYRFRVDPIVGVNKMPSQLMVQLRKYGAPARLVAGEIESLHNSKIEFDGEARINFVWIPDPDDPDGLYLNTDSPERQRAISFRLDREGKVRDNQGNLIPEKNDPTRLNGELSLEIGAVPRPDEPVNDNTVIGKAIAIGQFYSNQHDRREAGKLPQYYHNRASFSPEYGQADFFAGLVEKISAQIEEKYFTK